MVPRALFLTFLILVVSFFTHSDPASPRNSFQENVRDTSVSVSSVFAAPRQRQYFAQIKENLLNIGKIENLPLKNPDAATPELKVQSALAIDFESGMALFDLNSQVRWPIASLTKLLTAAVVAENIGWEKPVSVSEKAWNTEGTAGSLLPGEVYKSGDLIKAMLVVSSNDAAAALAEFYGEENFLEAMRQKALALGISEASFVDPTGLSFLNQASAADLVKLTKYILIKHPELLEITRQKSVELLEVNSGQKKTLTNINLFAGQSDFLGGKTGFIDASGSNLISVFQYQNRKIIIIVLGTDDRFGQTELLYNWIKNSYEF
jgi:D-alanyl-D-alanine carboxypeptidase